jgi:hypothetical protein
MVKDIDRAQRILDEYYIVKPLESDGVVVGPC